jgi:hypothetical protein
MVTTEMEGSLDKEVFTTIKSVIHPRIVVAGCVEK